VIDVCVREVDGVWFGVAHEGEKVFATVFASDKKRASDGLLESIRSDFSFQQVSKGSVFAERVIALLKDVYDGKKIAWVPNLAMDHLSEHTQKVLMVAKSIPMGYVASYSAVAKAAGASPRGVGRVMALNPFAPLVPCHRVVGSDFSLVGYGGGLDNKLEYLKRERKGFTSKREIPVDGTKLVVFPVEFVLKKLRK
jgi:methylated-DNA-[protein]-cysteine S-methyltransferase